MNSIWALSVAALLIGGSLVPGTPLNQAAAQQRAQAPQRQQGQASGDAGFRYPKLVLERKLAKIFTVSDCEYISGMTCRIHYNGTLPLPSRVFFTEFDDGGLQAGFRVRLIYPKLQHGETGRATFRIRSVNPAKVVLQGEWKGRWRNPH